MGLRLADASLAAFEVGAVLLLWKAEQTRADLERHELYLPRGWQLLPEFLLTRLPQRVDIVVIRRVEEPAGTPRKIHSILDHLRPHTLIEHKGPTDDLDGGDALTLLGYAAQYMRMVKVSDPSALCLMVVSDRISAGFIEQVERLSGRITPMGSGLWRGEIAGLILHGVETREACRGGATERLLYAFSRAYLSAPVGILPLDAEEAQVYTALYQQVEQFRKKRGSMALRDIDAAQESYAEVFAELIDRIPPEIRVRGLTPEQRLEGLAPEQRLEGLAPEQRLEGLTPEQLVELLTSDRLLSALSPEVRAQLAKKLQH